MSRLVFITGASSGIGQALAWRFYQAGYWLALVARRTGEIESWTSLRQISALRYRIYSADVALPASIVATGQACMMQQGVLAVGQRICRASPQTPQHRCLSDNFFGCFGNAVTTA